MKYTSIILSKRITNIKIFYAGIEKTLRDCDLLSEPQCQMVRRCVADSEEMHKLLFELQTEQSVASLHNIAEDLTNIFSRKAFLIVLSFVQSYSDRYVVMILQSILVCTIAYLGGREISFKSAIDFTCGLTGISLLDNACRKAIHKLTEIAKIPELCIGSNVLSGEALGMTRAVGQAAIAYYIDGKTISEAKKTFKTFKKIKYPNAIS